MMSETKGQQQVLLTLLLSQVPMNCQDLFTALQLAIVGLEMRLTDKNLLLVSLRKTQKGLH